MGGSGRWDGRWEVEDGRWKWEVEDGRERWEGEVRGESGREMGWGHRRWEVGGGNGLGRWEVGGGDGRER